MLFKIRTEGKKSFHSLLRSLRPQSLCPTGPCSSQAPGQGCSRYLSSKKAPQCLCPAVRAGIHSHGMEGKGARCRIPLMSQVPLQLATDFGYVFLELAVISISILSHLCESLWVAVVLSLQVWVCCETAGRCGGVSTTCSLGCCSRRPRWEPHIPWCLHSQTFPLIPVWASRLQLSAVLCRAYKNVSKPDKGSYYGESKLLSEVS